MQTYLAIVKPYGKCIYFFFLNNGNAYILNSVLKTPGSLILRGRLIIWLYMNKISSGSTQGASAKLWCIYLNILDIYYILGIVKIFPSDYNDWPANIQIWQNSHHFYCAANTKRQKSSGGICLIFIIDSMLPG